MESRELRRQTLLQLEAKVAASPIMRKRGEPRVAHDAFLLFVEDLPFRCISRRVGTSEAVLQSWSLEFCWIERARSLTQFTEDVLAYFQCLAGEASRQLVENGWLGWRIDVSKLGPRECLSVADLAARLHRAGLMPRNNGLSWKSKPSVLN